MCGLSKCQTVPSPRSTPCIWRRLWDLVLLRAVLLKACVFLFVHLHASHLATLFCVSSSGATLLPGTEPTVDTVSVQPIPAYWYYVIAAGGAVVVLVSVALALVLHYHRFRYAAKKSDHSITYKTSHYANGAPVAMEPTLTIKLEQDPSLRC